MFSYAMRRIALAIPKIMTVMAIITGIARAILRIAYENIGPLIQSGLILGPCKPPGAWCEPESREANHPITLLRLAD